MRISEPRLLSDNNKRTYQVDVESGDGRETLWYSLHESFGDLLTDAADAPLVALLVPAMQRGEDIYIDGAISGKLYYCCSQLIQSLLRNIFPFLHQISIYPKHLRRERRKPAAGVATGFSGGIDSYCAVADHYNAAIPERFKVTHLLFNNVGSHGSGGEPLFRKRFERLQPTAERMGLPLLMINSNLDLFYGKNLGFRQTHTLRNASVALLLQGGVGRYLYASAHKYSDVLVDPKGDIACSDLMILPLISTETLDAFSVGSEYSRVQKTLRVAELTDSYRTLDVCVEANNTSGYTNCSKCWKCRRTLTTLEIAGYLERYSASFDLDSYRSQRKIFMASLLGSRDSLQREIVEFAKERRYSFPLRSRLIHHTRLLPILDVSKRGVRRLEQLRRRVT